MLLTPFKGFDYIFMLHALQSETKKFGPCFSLRKVSEFRDFSGPYFLHFQYEYGEKMYQKNSEFKHFLQSAPLYIVTEVEKFNTVINKIVISTKITKKSLDTVLIKVEINYFTTARSLAQIR